MEIVIGTTYVNRTYSYLRPALKMLGPTFVTKFNSFFKIAYGLHDTFLDGTPIENQRTIFVLIDTFFNANITKDSLNWMKNQEYYIADYPYDGFDGRLTMLILEFPPKLGDIYDKFLEGKYSYMYTYSEIEDLFTPDNPAVGILTRRKDAREKFVARVNEIFNTTVSVEDYRGEGIQYDFPPIQKEEFFNYKE